MGEEHVPRESVERIRGIEQKGAYVHLLFKLRGLPRYGPPLEHLNAEPMTRFSLGLFTEPEELQAVRNRNAVRAERQEQRLTVGIARAAASISVPARQMSWKPVVGGHAARVAVTSPEAGSLRLALDLAGVPADVEMIFFGSADEARIEGPLKVGAIADRHGVTLVNVFHAGDGNLHPNICYDRSDPDLVERVRRASTEIMAACVAAGGSITGEHGVGSDKIDYMPLMFDATTLAVMCDVRRAFDPEGRANPGKVIPLRSCREWRAGGVG